MDPAMKRELIKAVRAQFEERKNVKDIEKLTYYLSVGKRDFKMVADALDMSGGRKDYSRHPFFPHTMKGDYK